MNNSIPYIGEILATLTALIWAMAVILFKKSGERMHPIALNLFKDFLALILIVPTVWLFGESHFRNVPFTDYLLLFASGALGIGISDTLLFMCLNLLGAGLYSIVACLYSPFIITMSILWLGETLSFLQVVGTLLIISAVLTAVGRNGKHNISRRNLWLGVLLGVAANAATAVGIVIIKPLLGRSPLMWVTEVRLFSGAIVLLLILAFHPARRLITAPIMNLRSWMYTIGGSFAGAYLSMILWLAAMKLTQASVASALNQTSNVFVFIFAALILREKIDLPRVIGITLAVGGSLLVTFG